MPGREVNFTTYLFPCAMNSKCVTTQRSGQPSAHRKNTVRRKAA
jgi:hypothetical protein